MTTPTVDPPSRRIAIEEEKNWIISDLFQLKTDHFRNPIIFHPFWNCDPVSIPRYHIRLLSDHDYPLVVYFPLYDSIFAQPNKTLPNTVNNFFRAYYN